MAAPFQYQQLEQTLLQSIHSQRIPAGGRLPSVQALCRQYRLSKATVLHALRRLEAQGVIEARPKSGFYVIWSGPERSPPQVLSQLMPPAAVTVSDLLLDIMRRGAAFDVLPAAAHSTETLPGVIELNRAIGRALRRARGDSAQQYDDPEGLPALREQLARRLNLRGCHLQAADLCITAGCQNALFLALMACCRPGDVVAVEAPGFYGVLQLLEQLQLQVVEVPSSPVDGLNMDALEQVLQRWPVTACVVSPAFSTPAGARMPAHSRQRLLALAGQYDLTLIEDDIYADTALLDPPDPLKAHDPDGRVILCSSFSKILSRDLRLGWIAGGRWHRQIVQLKLVTQLATGRAVQQGLADFLADGSYQAHLRRQHYRLHEQKAQLLSALSEWPLPVNVSQPQGGLTLWVELPASIDTQVLYNQALRHGIVIMPGRLFTTTGQFGSCLRISFAHPWTPERRKALQQIGQLAATLR
ncbi:PLP-dependent aminotransferase family protein [Venatoribacter cucullus]|uniref:aminotransferase-like domain-containing protein n=1 Tax=Venatoribacter cucullus TaxID=2661630 RepID=UPI00223E9156|nr:PLP-dependent aminotransferase family protein [Venatoribacter cucullus]UZK02667.1 aminotransferase class I/II-fold pyridoxal phosphate-dependent enzyme [Venatoribacter cucullus]